MRPETPIDEIKADLKRDEGYCAHAYQDHLGFWTIGHGRMIDERRAGGINPAEADFLLVNDISNVFYDLDRVLPWWREMPSQVQRGMANMCFQLGLPTLMGFRRMLAALKDRDFATAAKEALDSKWAGQTPERAQRIANLYRRCSG